MATVTAGCSDHHAMQIELSGERAYAESLSAGPTAVALVGDTVWAAEGQLSHLFDAKSGPPKLPFRIVGAPAGK